MRRTLIRMGLHLFSTGLYILVRRHICAVSKGGVGRGEGEGFRQGDVERQRCRWTLHVVCSLVFLETCRGPKAV